MQLLPRLTSLALVGILVVASATCDDNDLVITKDFFKDKFIIYRSEHDIVNIVVPLNSLNFDESNSSEDDAKVTIFFVEADIQTDGTHQYKGLFVLKDGKATKILPNGRDAAASDDNSTLVFFGAENGLYVYNENTNSADKYGPITDSIIAIEKEKTGDILYILTENHEVFKVSNNGEKKDKLENIVNARQIILDYKNNLYFFSDDNKPLIRTTDGIKPIQGLPKDLKKARFIKAPFYLENGVLFITDEKIYDLFSNGTSQISDVQIDRNIKPTAYAQEAVLDQYYGYNKNIYEFNMLGLLMSAAKDEQDELGSYINSKASSIITLASNSKGKTVRTKVIA